MLFEDLLQEFTECTSDFEYLTCSTPTALPHLISLAADTANLNNSYLEPCIDTVATFGG